MHAATDRLTLRLEIDQLLTDFWYEVDHNWGANAPDYYTEDGVFTTSGGKPRVGREAIRAFYTSRRDRGARIARHVVTNLRVTAIDATTARADWILLLHAADGEPVLESEPPILIADVVDECVKCPDGQWRFRSRVITALFKGARPTTA
jgi:hypothetical protein